jgi:hypothetical protein
VNVTAHPYAAWTAQQIVEAVGPRADIARLIRDRDGIYTAAFDARYCNEDRPHMSLGGDLKSSNVTRPELHTDGENRGKFRVHHLRERSSRSRSRTAKARRGLQIGRATPRAR